MLIEPLNHMARGEEGGESACVDRRLWARSIVASEFQRRRTVRDAMSHRPPILFFFNRQELRSHHYPASLQRVLQSP